MHKVHLLTLRLRHKGKWNELATNYDEKVERFE